MAIQSNVMNEQLQQKVFNDLKEVNVDCRDQDIEVCYRLKERRTVAKFREFSEILWKKKY